MAASAYLFKQFHTLDKHNINNITSSLTLPLVPLHLLMALFRLAHLEL